MNRWQSASVILPLLAAAAAMGQVPPAAAKPAIVVSGSAEIRVPPNEVNLRLGVETRDVKLDPAVAQNEERLKAVLKFLKESGIEAKDLQTDYVEIFPAYDSDRRVQQVTPEYYVVRRTIGVRLRKVAQFDDVLQGALKSGVNHVHGIDFRTTELRKHRDAARQNAIRAAKEKAEALAKELGSAIGKPQQINENTWGGASSWGSHAWGRNYYGAHAMQNVSQNVAAGGGEAPEGNLAVGQISVTATVNVTFELE
jgi:uncharacterized protein YggE